MFSNDTVADGMASNDTASDYAASDYMISDGEHTDMYNELEELPDKSDDDELINRVSEKLGEMAEKTQQEAEYDTQLYEQDGNIQKI